VAGYYAAEARQLTTRIRARQRDAQMDLFLDANRGATSNKLDLHFLQTGEAVQQLAAFVQEREGGLRRGQAVSIEVVTGQGHRSDNGKSRLKPAIQNWLDQKKYQYSEVNPGCLKVHLKSSQ
jgi:DNA-nicking Smr family endonuclease